MYAPLPFFDPFMIANPTLPKLYWEVKSPEQLIANLYCIMEYLKSYENDQSDQINANTEAIAQIQKVIDSIANGEYFEQYIDGLAKWIDENLQELVARQAAYAFPTLWQNTDDGTWHFAMVIPETWDFLDFLWIFDESDETYHTALKY